MCTDGVCQSVETICTCSVGLCDNYRLRILTLNDGSFGLVGVISFTNVLGELIAELI